MKRTGQRERKGPGPDAGPGGFPREWASGVALLGLVCFGGATRAPGAEGWWGGDLFAPGAPIPVIQIRIDRTNLMQLFKEPRVYAAATIEEGGRVYTKVALRLKGQEGGSYRPLYDKPAFTLNFDRERPGQLFHGLDKVYLNNSVEDSTYMTEALCGELFKAAGVPVPRVTHALVELNGRSRGLYVLKEGFNKRFLRREFRDPDGNFYDGGLVADITDPLQRSSGEGPDNRADLLELARATREPDPAVRWERMEARVDMDRFMSFLAMEVITGHYDGYALNRNNYRIYQDPRQGKLVFLPTGMDLMFSEPESPPEPYLDGLVARAVMETPVGQERYRERLSELVREVFRLEAVTNRVNELRERIRPVLARLDAKQGRAHDEAVAELLEAVRTRAAALSRALDAPEPQPLQLEGAQPVLIAGWRPRDETGTALLEEGMSGDGVPVLRIQARGSKEAMPSWRAAVLLRPGRYRLACRARSEGVMPRRTPFGAGAGLRVAGVLVPRRNGLAGDSAWSELSYEFEVEPGTAAEEVELICELLATRGEAQFAAGSLRLIRLSP